MDKALLESALEGLPRIIKDYTARIPEDELDIRRSREAWTIREHIYHIAGVQPMFHERMLTIKNSERPIITPYNPSQETEEQNRFGSIEEAFTKYSSVRRKQLEVLSHLTDEEWSKKAEHPQYKEYGMAILLHHMLFHEYWHMYRIEEIWITKDEFFK